MNQSPCREKMNPTTAGRRRKGMSGKIATVACERSRSKRGDQKRHTLRDFRH